MASAKNARRPWSVVRAVAALVVGAMLLTVSGCAASAKLFDDLNGALKGRQGVMMTFNDESHSNPLRFCWVIPFQVRLFSLYI